MSLAEPSPTGAEYGAPEDRERLPFRDRFTQVARSFWEQVDEHFEVLDWAAHVRHYGRRTRLNRVLHVRHPDIPVPPEDEDPIIRYASLLTLYRYQQPKTIDRIERFITHGPRRGYPKLVEIATDGILLTLETTNRDRVVHAVRAGLSRESYNGATWYAAFVDEGEGNRDDRTYHITHQGKAMFPNLQLGRGREVVGGDSAYLIWAIEQLRDVLALNLSQQKVTHLGELR